MKAGHFPAVSYLKAASYQDGHAGYSDPLDEQAAIVRLVNFLQRRPEWKDTAVILTWDDSDGWYDHAYAKPTSPSFDASDQLNGNGVCGAGQALPGLGGKPVNGRCGPGTRIPFLIVSPWAKTNHVSHGLITQASVVRFIEDNWLHGHRLGGGSFDAGAGSIADMFDFTSSGNNPPLYLDPATGAPLSAPPAPAGADRSGMPGRTSWLVAGIGLLVAVCGYRNCGCGRSPLALSLRRQRASAPAGIARAGREPATWYDLCGRPLSRCPRWHNSAGSFSSMPAYRRPVGCPAPRVTARDMPMAPPGDLPAMRGGPPLSRQGVRAVPSLMYLERQPNFSIGPDNEENENVSL